MYVQCIFLKVGTKCKV